MSAAQSYCFALLDDGDAQAGSRLYTGYQYCLRGAKGEDLALALTQMQDALLRGYHAVGLFSYELGAEQQGILPHSDAAPWFEVLLFANCERLDPVQLEAWLQQQADNAPSGLAQLATDIDEIDFARDLNRIHAYIEAGDTYQVNYTFRLHFSVFGRVASFYRKLRERQRVPYGAWIALPDGRSILSFSPELFVQHRAGALMARPMKGTAPASDNVQIDAALASALAQDPKNRAENLMIVDLLRNDLGRIARTGSVQVPALFEVTRFGKVLQMTSTVTATLRADVTLPEVFRALFPCGSITGAPKQRTMQIIRELEPSPRGIYTGAIGWFDQPGPENRVGDFCLSVPIRTLSLQPPDEDGVRLGEMGVGAGIVYDSEAKSEYRECQLKAGFLTGLGHEFDLFETMLVSKDAGCHLLEAHLLRLANSAQYFGFICDLPHIHAAFETAVDALPAGGGMFRLKLSLNCQGRVQIQSAPLQVITGSVKVLLAQRDPALDTVLLQHKTSHRSQYDLAWRAAEASGAFDVLFFNQQGQLTEGGRSNVFIKLSGRWYTPPLTAGLLPGVMRARLLADPAWAAQEKPLYADDLRAAQEIALCNALRGVLRADIVWPCK
jgi:para-aminobenzoate synthetase/4-amino-4-deoxychorismate lyase